MGGETPGGAPRRCVMSVHDREPRNEDRIYIRTRSTMIGFIIFLVLLGLLVLWLGWPS
jgi:hypothetical protein